MPATDRASRDDARSGPLQRRGVRWVPRLVAGAAAAAAWLAVHGQPATFAIEIAMAATRDTTLQIFYDRGAGIRVEDTVLIPVRASREPAIYRLPIPAGVYRQFRIDPSDRDGIYTITRIRLSRANGEAVSILPVEALRAAAQATLEPTGEAVVVRVPEGASDPQLLYDPPGQIAVAPTWRERADQLIQALPVTLAAFVLAWLLDYLPLGRVVARLASTLERSPHAFIASAAVAASILATYPLFLGRSLVSPNNGGMFMLYDTPPFVYGSTDFSVEDARETDVGSMMWNILTYSRIGREALAAGELPLWNRYNAMGRPLWGQAQHFFLEPLHLAALMVSDAALRADVVFVTARAVFAVGAGFATVGATGSPQAAAIVACLAPFVGYFSYRFNHPAYFSIVYAPWILWASIRLARRSGRELAQSGGVLALFSALQLVGSTPKEGAIVWGVTHATGMLALLLAGGAAAERVRRVGTAALAVAIALLVAAPQWLVFLDTLSRAYTAYEVPQAFVLGWTELPGAMSLGAAMPGRPFPSVNGLVAVLALGALAMPSHLWRSGGVPACLAGATLSLLLACGILPERIVLGVPLLKGVYHVWNVFMTAAIVPLLVAAGAGVATLRAAPARGAVAAAAAVLLLALTIDDAGFPPFLPGLSTFKLVAIGPPLAFALVYACRACHAWSGGAALVALAALAIGVLPNGLHLETSNAAVNRTLFQPRPRVALERLSPPLVAARERAAGEPFRIVGLGNVLMGGTQVYYQLEGLGGPDALALMEEVELLGVAGVPRIGWRPVFGPTDLRRIPGLLDMLGVRFVLARPNQLARELARVETAEADPLQLVERPTAWPRAFFVDGVRRHADVLELAAALEASSTPFASVAATDGRALAVVAGLPPLETRLVAARGYRLTPNRTAFVIEAPGPGVAVLGEAFEPLDFIATLNDERVDYFKVNHAFKGVVTPHAGTWRVEFRYRPRLLSQSWTAGLAGIAAAMVLIAARRRHA